MPANKNALIRYKTIDACLRNRYRIWTLNDLIDACSDALYDCEGRQENLSRRTIQKDLAIMRSNKLGYNAPIEVYDGKYYRYSDPDYSIMNMPISDKDYRLLNEVVGLLSQFEDFEFFQQISDMVSRLQDMLSITHDNRKPVVMMDTNRLLRGLKWLNPIYHCIENHIAIRIIYRKYHAKKDRETVFFSVLLKEYNNRWFLFGRNEDEDKVVILALDRIVSIDQMPDKPFLKMKDFNPDEWFKDIIGVTRPNQPVVQVLIHVEKDETGYIETKPLHSSQMLVADHDDGSKDYSLQIIPNRKFFNAILSFGPGITVKSPKSLVQKFQKLARDMEENYKKSKK